MFCGKCGTNNPDTNKFCKNCGRALIRLQSSDVSSPAAPVPVPAYPTAPPGYYAPTQPVQLSAGIPAVAKPSSNKGLFLLDIMSILAGAVSWFLFPFICGILAIVLGGVVLFKSKNKKGIGAIIVAILGIIGIVIGLASIIVYLFYFSFFPPVGL